MAPPSLPIIDIRQFSHSFQVSEAEKAAKEAEEALTEALKKEEVARGEKLAAELSAWELEGKIDPLKSELNHYLETANTLKTEVKGSMCYFIVYVKYCSTLWSLFSYFNVCR